MKRSDALRSLGAFLVFSLTIWGLLPSAVLGAVPQLINFQGVLKNGSGQPVADNTYSVTFKIYDAAAGGNLLWTETQSVTTTGGLFAAILGSTTPVPDTAFKGANRYLGLTVSPDPEMAQRQQLVSVGYSYRVNSVDGASGGTITSKVSIGPGHTNTGTNAFAAGDSNIATGTNAFVAGKNNRARGNYSVVSGGGGTAFGAADSNSALGGYSVVGGGNGNTASGSSATVPGGQSNTAAGNFSFAAGRHAKANHAGAFVWGGDALADFASTGNNQFLIRASGGVGIGTNSPSKMLEVAGSIKVGTNDTVFSSNLSSNSPLSLQAPAGTTRMFINDANGNVGIGTASPNYQLHVFRNSAGGNGIIVENALPTDAENPAELVFKRTGIAASQQAAIGMDDTNRDFFIWVNGGDRLNIKENGNVGIGTTAPAARLHVNGTAGNNTGVWSNLSDRRLKREIESIQNALETVNRLEPVSFRWKDSKKDAQFGRVRGLIAQDVEKVIPEWIKTDPDGYKRIEPIGNIALLIGAIKEQEKTIQTLQAEIGELKAEVKKLAAGKKEDKKLGLLR